ncbi:MAG: DUF1289 domain-containing protein [Gammaproteobacteria bacterium]|nr:DUF1289 domain-containing protein [Gammaproteobacteria bacterium]MDE1888048.1 DUF1289 domain-containing protein [Gammaproteobacteria bacterium]MDE2024670.1 DUF1289 domain-containing protein [Gammaproteobacteria bacterium]MDE2273843.1 DUF1289 domain-containing protein [Gammaproteobacteria bacterium]
MTNAAMSPCVRNCCLDEREVCLGCGRTLDEIRRWSEMTEPEKHAVLTLAAQRRAERLARFPEDWPR